MTTVVSRLGDKEQVSNSNFAC